ncbi:MAG: alkaline phosphatase family protein [Polyangiales bacterium]
MTVPHRSLAALALALVASIVTDASEARPHRRRRSDDARGDSDRMRRRSRYERTREPTTRHGRPITIPLATAPVQFNPAPAPTQATRPYDHVVVVSIDGLRPDAVTMTDAPNLRRLRQIAAWSTEARTITRSYTLPSHTSMLTGVDADRHGLVHNNFTPRYGFTRAPSALYYAHDAGFTTAMFVSKPKFRHIAIPGSVDVFSRPDYVCRPVMNAAVEHLRQTREGLTFIHLSEPDGAGHERGWMTASYLRAIAAADVCMGTLLTAIEARADRDRILLIISADHGGHGRTHGSTREEDMRIPWIAWGSRVVPGEFSDPVSTMDTAATALAALGVEVPADMVGRPVQRALSRTAPVAQTTSAQPAQQRHSEARRDGR